MTMEETDMEMMGYLYSLEKHNCLNVPVGAVFCKAMARRECIARLVFKNCLIRKLVNFLSLLFLR